MGEIPDDSGEKSISPEDMQTGREREDIGEKFKSQLPEIKRTLFAHPDSNVESLRIRDQKFEQVSIDESKLFVSHRAETVNEIENDRSYFAYNPTTGNFEQVANCKIQTKLNQMIEFTRVGRIAGKYDREIDSLQVYFGEETIRLGYEISIFLGEPAQISDQNSTQTKETSAYPQFDDGKLTWLQLDAPLADSDRLEEKPQFYETPEEIEELAQEASVQGGLQLQNEGGQTWATVTYNSSQRIFEIVYNDSKGQPAYSATIPRAIDTQIVIDETRAKILYENPELPPDVDEYWKGSNLGELLGVTLKPIVG